MFGVSYKYTLNPAKPDRITLHMTPRTYIDALKPLAVVYGVIAAVVVVVAVADQLNTQEPTVTELDPDHSEN